MAPIHTLKIKNFKAFPVEETIKLEGKNLLLYGENGSGKSSIYFALYTLLQGSIKGKNTDKYFDRANPENLLNVFTEGVTNDSHIQISLNDNPAKFYTLASGGITPQADVAVIEQLNLASDFISHRLLVNFYNFRNSNQINLIRVFERDIFPYVKTSNQSEYLADVYQDIKTNVPFKLRKGNVEAKQVSQKYLDRIDYFNSELETLVNNINLEATDFYNQNFRHSSENQIEIKLYYQADNSPARDAGDSNKYYVRYEEVIKKINIANAERDYKTGFKELTEPFIRLVLRENTGTEAAPNWKKIDRPQSYLNEAKLTGIALSIRFALLVGANRPNVEGRILALDDLLISLDMSNRDRVIKIILNKFIAENPFKIYILTHDKIFYNLCKQRINQTGNSSFWVYREMYADASQKPRRPFIDKSTNYFEKADAHLKAFDYSASANALRQGLENFVFNFLPENLRYSKRKINNEEVIVSKTLDEMLSALKKLLEKAYNQDISVINDLFVYKDILLNPLSHDNINTPVFRNELEAVLAIVPTLSSLKTNLLRDISTNNIIQFIETDDKGIENVYHIELYENLRSFVLLDGQFYLSRAKCKNIKCVRPSGAEILFNNLYPSLQKACNRIAEILGLGKNKYPNDTELIKKLKI